MSRSRSPSSSPSPSPLPPPRCALGALPAESDAPCASPPRRRPAPAVAQQPFFLASAPLSDLSRSIALTEQYDGEYAAGDAEDLFNSIVLQGRSLPAAELAAGTLAWQIGWLGKVTQCFNMLKKYNPGQAVTAIAIAGGPACDWERGVLYNEFEKKFDNFKLKQCGDYEEYMYWLQRNYG